MRLRPKIISRTSFESSFYADHNGTIPSFISHSRTHINLVQCSLPSLRLFPIPISVHWSNFDRNGPSVTLKSAVSANLGLTPRHVVFGRKWFQKCANFGTKSYGMGIAPRLPFTFQSRTLETQSPPPPPPHTHTHTGLNIDYSIHEMMLCFDYSSARCHLFPPSRGNGYMRRSLQLTSLTGLHLQ